MRFVPIKTDEQQAVLSLHRVRQSFIKVRTAQANQIRGLLSEFGVVIPQGITHIARRLPEIIEKSDLPTRFRELLQRLYTHLILNDIYRNNLVPNGECLIPDSALDAYKDKRERGEGA